MPPVGLDVDYHPEPPRSSQRTEYGDERCPRSSVHRLCHDVAKVTILRANETALRDAHSR